MEVKKQKYYFIIIRDQSRTSPDRWWDPGIIMVMEGALILYYYTKFYTL